MPDPRTKLPKGQAKAPATPPGKGPPAPPGPRRPAASLPGTFEISDGLIGNPQAQLDEVEKALSALDGRHPQFARAEREKAEAMARRRREIEAAARSERRRARRNWALAGVFLSLLGVAGWFARDYYARGQRALASTAPLAASFAPLGFSETVPSPWGKPDRLEVPIASGTCAIALGAADGKPTTVEVVHDGTTLETQGSFGFCTCSNETVTISAKGTGAVGVRLLRTDARSFGSVLGFDRAKIKPAIIDECACMDDQLDAWLTSAESVLTPADPHWLEASPPRAVLGQVGFKVTASAPPSTDLVPLTIPAGGCSIAVPSGASDALALRVEGGSRAIESGPGTIAVCSKTKRTFGVFHQGAGMVTLASTDATRVGGREGLRAILERAGLSTPRLWTEPADLSWDANLALTSAYVAAAPNQIGDLKDDTKLPSDAQLLAFSMTPDSKLALPAAGGVACEPFAAGATNVICAERSPSAFPGSKGHIGFSYAPLPVWLKTLATAPPAAIVPMITLARRLAALGFEPTVLEGVTETSYGASVLGRGGDDAIVAVTLQTSAPYTLPLGEGRGWALDGDPNIVPLAGGRTIALRSRTSPGGSEESRRTVVFRRADKGRAESGPTK